MPPKGTIVDGKRRCSQCREMVELESFKFYIRNGVRVYQWCVDCNRRYQRNRPPTDNAKSLVKQKQSLVLSIKRSPCTDCGLSFDPVAMDFDHVRGEKRAGIAQMVMSSHSVTALEDELRKCELVCANCHRVRTAKRGRSTQARIAMSRGMGHGPVKHIESGIVYATAVEAARSLGLRYGSINKVLRGKMKSTGGQTFQELSCSV